VNYYTKDAGTSQPGVPPPLETRTPILGPLTINLSTNSGESTGEINDTHFFYIFFFFIISFKFISRFVKFNVIYKFNNRFENEKCKNYIKSVKR
jgi:hypothetical protein